MKAYLCFDGVGTTTRAILFNERGPIGYGQSGGTNTNFTTLEDCRGNIAACLSEALRGVSNPVIETLYAMIVGPGEILKEELCRRAEVANIRFLGEGEAGILAGALRTSGLVAMSGTGSDAFYVATDGHRAVVGAYGAILGDDGSGTWIGQAALRKAIAYGEGWGEATIFRAMIFKAWGIQEPFDIVRYIHDTPSPFRTVASAVPVIAEAARRGDRVCLELFSEAGRLMAAQMLALIRRERPPEDERICVCCGGTWKAHPRMYESFVEQMRIFAPDVPVQKPAFEHVMAGVVINEMAAKPELSPDALRVRLAERYAPYRITW